MGTRIKPWPTQGCLDVHSLADLDTTAAWIRANDVPFPDFADPRRESAFGGILPEIKAALPFCVAYLSGNHWHPA